MKPVIHPKDFECWFWPVIFAFPLAGMVDWYTGFYIASGISAFQALYFIAKTKSFSDFPVQVHIACLIITTIPRTSNKLAQGPLF